MNLIVSRVVGAILLLVLCPSSVAQKKISIMVNGIDRQIYMPAKLAEQLGYFKEQGLNVELLTVPSGADAANELLVGAVQGVVGFYDHTLDLQAKGKIVESVVQFSQAPGEVELVSSRVADKIKTPADFKGKTLGVTGLGSSTHFLSQYLAASNGVNPTQVSYLGVGAGTTFIAAMKQGRIDAGMTTEPTVSRMLKTGDAKLLVDMRIPETTRKALGGLYPASCLYMQTTWVNSHKDEVQKLANALVKTLKYIHDHNAEEIAAKMPADYYAGDQALYIKALADGKAMFTADGRMPESGPPTVLKILSAFNKNVQGKNIDLSKTYTTEFVSKAK